ncbi:unnamed protein product [Moritella viscosa]|nr:unnamed protein product [Moritella viscosa]SHO19270.1 unnamed protein product [Moritella viscosa]
MSLIMSAEITESASWLVWLIILLPYFLKEISAINALI